MNIYEIDYEKDDEDFDRYQELIVADLEVCNQLEEYKSRYGWFDNYQLIGDDWFQVKIVVDKDSHSHSLGDYPYLHGFSGFILTPIFSQKAVDVLADLLEGSGELLPLVCDFGKYYAFNITRKVEALDEERSEFKLNSELYSDLDDEPDFQLVTKFAFDPDRVANLNIFKLPKINRHNVPLVTDRFVQRVREANLKGFAFKLLWSSSELMLAAV
jgi:hypothetical protein